jgi:hypothetical protein
MASLYAFIAEFASLRTVVLTSLSLLLTVVVVAHFSTLRYPVEIPRIREREGKRYFSLRTRLAYYTDAKELFREAYEKVRAWIQSLYIRNVLTLPVLQKRQNLSRPRSRIPQRSRSPCQLAPMGHVPLRSSSQPLRSYHRYGFV